MVEIDTAAPARSIPDGPAVREHLVQVTTDLVFAQGVAATRAGDVALAAGVDRTDLFHHFPTMPSLIRAVLTRHADTAPGTPRPVLGGLDTFDALHLWADLAVERRHPRQTPAPAQEHRRWEALLRAGLSAMLERGELQPAADPQHLTMILLAAHQGGGLLAQIYRDTTPLSTALGAALRHVASFARQPATALPQFG